MSDTTKPPDIGHWLAALVAMWSNTSMEDECVEFLVGSFDLSIIKIAAEKINKDFGELLAEKNVEKIVISHSGEAKMMGGRFFRKIVELKNKEVGFYVPFEDLVKIKWIPMAGAAGPAAEKEVPLATRLSQIEESQAAILDDLRILKNQRQPPAPAAPAPAPPPAIQVNGGQTSSFANIVTGGGNVRSRSNSQASVKRTRSDDDDNKENTDKKPRVRKPAKVTQGSNKVVVKRTSKVAAPVDFYIGHVHSELEAAEIKDVLIEVSNSMPEEMKLDAPLEVEVVECLTRPREDGSQQWVPWRNWRVRVPERFREHMSRGEALPAGWTSRRYYPARQSRKPPTEATGNPYKKYLSEAAASHQKQMPVIPGAHFKES